MKKMVSLARKPLHTIPDFGFLEPLHTIGIGVLNQHGVLKALFVPTFEENGIFMLGMFFYSVKLWRSK